MTPVFSFIPLILYALVKIAYGKAIESYSLDQHGFQFIDFSMLSLTMLIFISIIAFFVLTYAQKNFEREKKGKNWLMWSLFTVYSVDLLVISTNLLLILAAFFSISFCFHRLLLCYPQRKKSQSVAWKKFVLSRLGDLFFICFCISSYYYFGSEDFQKIQHSLVNVSQESFLTITLWPSMPLARFRP